MIKYSCCIPGGSFMPEGVRDVPASLDEQIITNCRTALAAGFDYTECGAAMLAGLTDEQFAHIVSENEKGSLRIYACNSLIPEWFPLAGEGIDYDNYPALTEYLTTVMTRMNRLGATIAVLGSGTARSIPEGFDRAAGCRQLENFMALFAAMGEKYGVRMAIEPLRRKETNTLTNLTEAACIARRVNRSGVKVLADSFHMYEEGTPVETLASVRDVLIHCHMSEPISRAYPGADDSADKGYNRLFADALIACGYDGVVTAECKFDNYEENVRSAFIYMKELFESTAKAAAEIRITRDMNEEPVFVLPAEGRFPDNMTAFRCGDGRVFPAQVKGDGAIAIVTGKKGETVSVVADCDAKFTPVKLEHDEGMQKVSVKIRDELFSEYVYGCKIGYKPYFGPVCDAKGNAFTRLDFSAEEHPHHRSVFVGIGSVNGVDCWNERPDGGHVVNKEIKNIVTGAAYGSFDAVTVWQDTNGMDLVDETTTYTVYSQQDSCRYLDLKFIFTATYGDVIFGKTKEAGPLGVRMRDELRADKGTGIIENSYGGVSEAECWSKAANWVDYSGTVKDGNNCDIDMGVTIFDNENNERYPACWHVRNYGLFAPNNFYFKGGYELKKGESIEYNYRIVFHKSKFVRADAVNRFINYTHFAG